MTKIERFWSYLGFSDKTINEQQFLKLLCLLGKEQVFIKLYYNEFDLINYVLDIYIEKMETNSFLNLTEQEIMGELCLVS